MRTGRSYLFLACLLASVAYGRDGEGSASISPNFSVAGKLGTWTVTFTVGPSGIATGGGIWVEMPTGWTDQRFSDPQLNPEKPHYFNYRASRLGVALYYHLYNLLPSTGKRHWFRRVFYLGVKEGRLQPGDTITLVIGDTAGGKNAGTVGPTFTPGGNVTVTSDTDGDGKAAPIAHLPFIETRPAEAVEMQAIAPTNVVVNRPFEVQVNVYDQFANLALYSGSIALRAANARIEPVKSDFKRFRVTLATPGFYRLEAEVDSRFGRVRSNPIEATISEKKHNIYWGDIHSHTGISHDGSGADPYPYARDVSRLDFYSLTDHIMVNNPALRNMGKVGNDYGEGTTAEDWAWTRTQVQKYYAPGKFVTILGFEYTLVWPWGHHNVYFRGDNRDYFVGDNVPDVRSLWNAIAKDDAYTIPHHLGIDWNDGGVTSSAVEWTDRNDRQRPALEIYSTHGESELFNPSHPLSYENQKKRISLPGPHYAQDGWKTGARLGVLASSDNHTAQPGQRNDGLAAVLAARLDRDSVFDAIRTRHSYGTTGERIWLDFQVNGHHMGEEFTASDTPKVTFRAVGTDAIVMIEVVKLDLSSKKFTRLGILQPDSEDVSGEFWDKEFAHESMYYLRLKQKNLVRGREVWAWSSPIWVKRPPAVR